MYRKKISYKTRNGMRKKFKIFEKKVSYFENGAKMPSILLCANRYHRRTKNINISGFEKIKKFYPDRIYQEV